MDLDSRFPKKPSEDSWKWVLMTSWKGLPESSWAKAFVP